MTKYELTVILQSKEKDALAQKLKDILAKNGVAITAEDSWGIRKLAYEISGEREGFYFFANIEAAPDSVEKITAELGLDAGFLRSMFVRVPEVTVKPERKKKSAQAEPAENLLNEESSSSEEVSAFAEDASAAQPESSELQSETTETAGV